MQGRTLTGCSSILLVTVACAGDLHVGGGPGGKADGFDSFEDFKDSLYCEPETGACIVSGDIPIYGDNALREIFLRGSTGSSGALTVMRKDDVDPHRPAGGPLFLSRLRSLSRRPLHRRDQRQRHAQRGL